MSGDLWTLNSRTARAVSGSWNGPLPEGFDVAALKRKALLAEGFEPWSWASLPGLRYLPGTNVAMVVLFDPGDWRCRMYCVMTQRVTVGRI